MRHVLWCVFLTGCFLAGKNGNNGKSGANGSDGSQGPAGADAAYRWVDADGVEVSPNTQAGFFDEEERWWWVDLETGEATGTFYGAVYWSKPNCEGEAFVYSVRPREPFQVQGSDLWFVRPDDLEAEDLCAASASSGDNCSTYQYCYDRFVSLDESIPSPPVHPPSTGWTGPLRRAP